MTLAKCSPCDRRWQDGQGVTCSTWLAASRCLARVVGLYDTSAATGRRDGTFVVGAVARAERLACRACDERPERVDDVAAAALAAAVALRDLLPEALPLGGRGRVGLETLERTIVSAANVLHERCLASLGEEVAA